MTRRRGIAGTLLNGVRAVNARYRHPKIEMTPLVRTALLVLRLYLIVLIGLMVFKFVVVARS